MIGDWVSTGVALGNMKFGNNAMYFVSNLYLTFFKSRAFNWEIGVKSHPRELNWVDAPFYVA